MTKASADWDGAAVRRWLDSRIEAARADQVTAERGGRERQDDCDKAAAEEMVCAALRTGDAAGLQFSFAEQLTQLAARDDYVWRGVYNDTRFDRHVRSYLRKLVRMTKTNTGFDNLARFQ